jgi:hypothetical protein
MRVTPYFSSFPGISQNFPVADSAAPVIDSAVYYVNSVTLASCDTLKVAFSEPVNISQSVNPFLLSGKSASSYIFTLSRIGGAGAVDSFCVSPPGKGLPQTGDSIWIAVNGVGETSGLLQSNANNRKVALKVVRPKAGWKLSIACNPFTPGFICAAATWKMPGTVINIAPDPPSLAFRPISQDLKIYDILGDCIFENPVALQSTVDNTYNFTWDGRNKNGRSVGSGVYRAIITVVDENGTSSKSIAIGVKR